MSFIIQMARREIRSSWKRLLFFFLCIGIGVGAVVALRTFTRNANRAMTSEARALMTADAQADTTRPWSPETLERIDRVAAPPLVSARTETIEASAMARPADPSREGAQMVELKGVERPYPFYGTFELDDGRPFDHALLDDGGAIVAPLLLERLGVSVGDDIRIGESVFRIRGVVGREPGAGGGFRLGPRVFVAREAMEAAGLTGFAARARRRMLFKTAEDGAGELVKRLRAELTGNVVTVRSYRESEESMGEQYARAENFLALVGMVVLVLGGIGVSSVTRVFVEQKKKSIAVLKCLGATGRRVAAAYLAQTLALGLAGSLLGVALAKGALLFVAARFAESLPPNMDYSLSAGAVWQGLGLGVVVSLLFSALPLMRVRHVKPDILLRERDTYERGRRLDLPRWFVGLLVGVGLLLLVSWQAGELRAGLYFVGGLGAAAALLYASAWLLTAVVARARHLGGPFALRQAAGSLTRPGNQTRVVVMAVGLGAFLVMSVQSVRENLMGEFDLTRRTNLADMYVIDVQRDQAEGVARIVEGRTGARPELVPTVRARIFAVNGREVDLEQTEMRRERGLLGREYVVTYRPRLEENEQVVAGEFWGETPSPEAEVSIEEGMRGVAGLDVGGRITFDVQGRKIEARVTSVRRIDWRNSRTGFLVLFRPGTLEAAPQNLIAAINGPQDSRARARFQRALLDAYPNLSVIDVADIVRSVGSILSNLTMAVSFIGGFVLLSGALILVGSIAMTKFQRVYEAAVLKTLGAKRATLLAMLLAEYGLLGLAAGLVGSLAAVALSYAVARYLLEIPWAFTPFVNIFGVVATALLVTLVGALSSLDVLARKPLSILRGQ
ncbi:MAG TPA: FtsX-like permease family protein [Pyrinomonadaceae bacterium]|nr:FtsX-like permease family protein [Pyrinomonadaceae bacterium]